MLRLKCRWFKRGGVEAFCRAEALILSFGDVGSAIFTTWRRSGAWSLETHVAASNGV